VIGWWCNVFFLLQTRCTTRILRRGWLSLVLRCCVTELSSSPARKASLYLNGLTLLVPALLLIRNILYYLRPIGPAFDRPTPKHGLRLCVYEFLFFTLSSHLNDTNIVLEQFQSGLNIWLFVHVYSYRMRFWELCLSGAIQNARFDWLINWLIDWLICHLSFSTSIPYHVPSAYISSVSNLKTV